MSTSRTNLELRADQLNPYGEQPQEVALLAAEEEKLQLQIGEAKRIFEARKNEAVPRSLDFAREFGIVVDNLHHNWRKGYDFRLCETADPGSQTSPAGLIDTVFEVSHNSPQLSVIDRVGDDGGITETSLVAEPSEPILGRGAYVRPVYREGKIGETDIRTFNLQVVAREPIRDPFSGEHHHYKKYEICFDGDGKLVSVDTWAPRWVDANLKTGHLPMDFECNPADLKSKRTQELLAVINKETGLGLDLQKPLDVKTTMRETTNAYLAGKNSPVLRYQ